jgi:Flp pilus assembly protein TadG
VNRIWLSTKEDEGAVAIIFAAVAVVALILLAFVADRGMVYYTKAQMQTAVDAAALAGARSMCSGVGDPQDVAVQYAASNGVTVPRADVQTWTNNGNGFVYVPASRQLNLLFGGAVGQSSVVVTAEGAATKLCVGGGYAIYSESFVTLNGGGSTRVNVNGALFAGGPSGSITFNGQESHFNFSEGVFAPTSYGTGGYSVNGVSQTLTSVDTATQTNAATYAASIGLTTAIATYLTPVASPPSPIAAPNPGDVCTIDLGALVYATTQAITCAGDAIVSGNPSSSLKLVTATGAMSITSSVGDPTHVVIFQAGGDFDVTGTSIYGTLYSPTGSITTNGQGVSVQYGRVIVQSFRVNGNGGSFTADSSMAPFGSGVTNLTQ